MTALVLTLVAGALGYGIGSISSGYIVGKVYRNVDLRRVGSGSTGATNTLRALGPGAAGLVALFDILKGIAAVWVARSLVTEAGWSSYAVALAGLGAIAGHCWPAILAGRGGRGVATGLGTAVLVAWPSWLVSVPAFVIVILVTRMVSLGSLAAALFMNLGYLAFAAAGLTAFDPVIQGYLAAGALLVAWRHRPNLVRILKGTEHRIGERTAPPA